MWKCIIFDMDGLMFDSERIVGECLKKAALDYGYIVTDELRYKLLGRNKTDNKKILTEVFGQNYPYEKISHLTQKYKEQYINKNGLPIKDGLYDLLIYLKKHDILTAVASSSPLHVIKYYLEITQLTSYFDYIVSGDQVSNSKPDPEIFQNVLIHFDIEPYQALVLEDSQNGIMAAYNAHIPVICIPDLVVPEEKYKNKTLVLLDNLHKVIPFIIPKYI